MGIELDILVGHPEHDLLFIATQVARAAGLKDPADSIKSAKKHGLKADADRLATLIGESSISLPVDALGRKLRSTTLMISEPETYQLLLRGKTPQSEPFRKWVTEEVLPSIRKTGSYNVNESTSETGQKFAGELAELHAIITGFQEAVMARFGHQEEAILAKPNGFYRQDTAIQI